MPYQGKVYRPPSEADSLILQVTTGCPYNKCNFCSMYDNQEFSIKTISDLQEHIRSVSYFYDKPVESIFLADGNSIIIKSEQLTEILNLIKTEFPEVKKITTYGSARYVNKKSVEDLKTLKKAGLTRIHTGMESGDAEVLNLINKGTTPEEIIEAGRKVKEAEIELSQYYLVGAGGGKYSKQHAVNSARVIRRFNPDFIRLRTLIPIAGTKLDEMYKDNQFKLLNAHQALKEIEIFIKGLTDINSLVLSDHVSNYWDISGRLPQDKKSMLAEIKKALALDLKLFRSPTQGRI
ncbi:MAG: radical SAM protein [Bacillota bacterium]